MKDNFAIFLDIDGTIFDGKEIKKEDLDAIRLAREQGHKVFINTGRTLGIIPDGIKELEVDGIVAGLGTYITYAGKVLRNITIKKEILEKVAEYALSTGLTLQLQGEGKSLYINYDKEPEKQITAVCDITGKFAEYGINKFITLGQFSKEDRAFLSDDFDIFQYKSFGEVATKGYSKADGIRFIEEYLGISHENTIAMGDSANDLDMIEYAGIGVAMENGEETLKLAANYVTASVHEAGVAKAIYKFVLNEAE